MRDWEELRRAYAEEGLSLSELSRRSGVPYSTLCNRAVKEGWDAESPSGPGRGDLERIGRKLLTRLESCLDRGDEMDLKDLKTVTGALRELQALREDGDGGGARTLTVRFEGETEELSR